MTYKLEPYETYVQLNQYEYAIYNYGFKATAIYKGVSYFGIGESITGALQNLTDKLAKELK